MKIRDLIEQTGAKVLKNTDLEADVKISTDTRTIEKGDFYLPLKGASFDGEKFISQALEKGALGAFCTKEGQGTLLVEDTLTAYLELARYKRRTKNFKVIAVTGSSGKTTTKELIAAALSLKFKTFKTPLNHNNEIGLCQTIFEAPDDCEVLVLEMGMRGAGEIELLSKYSEPDISVICNVGTAHIGRLGSKENIARAKCEITKYQRGNLFIAHDDELIRKNLNFDGEKIFYSESDVQITEQTASRSVFKYKGEEYILNCGGNFNIENSLAAINCALALGVSPDLIREGLSNYHPIEKRWESVNAGGFEVINDSYNANPESVKAFCDTIFSLYKDYVPVLGDMGELGDDEVLYHKQVGEYINNHPKLSENTIIISIGNLSKNITSEITKCRTLHFEDIPEAVRFIRELPVEKKLFLKASRSMKFEQIIDMLSSNR